MKKEAKKERLFYSKKQEEISEGLDIYATEEGVHFQAYYDGKKFTERMPIDGKSNFKDAEMIFEGIVDNSKIKYEKISN